MLAATFVALTSACVPVGPSPYDYGYGYGYLTDGYGYGYPPTATVMAIRLPAMFIIGAMAIAVRFFVLCPPSQGS